MNDQPLPIFSDPDQVIFNHLESIVIESLGGPGGDPDYYHRIAAAHAYVLMEKLGLLSKLDDLGVEGWSEFQENDAKILATARECKCY